MKVFLSHSSHEKEFVEKVATRLGRANAHFDKYFFTTGDDLRHRLREALRESGIFCLFVSRTALNSIWVHFEIGEAEKLEIRRKLRPMVFFIEPGIRIGDIPNWLQEFHASVGPSANIVARQIEVAMCSQATSELGRLFLGREDLMSKFSQSLLPLEASSPPRFFAFTGLDGIGRRTFAEQAVRNNLSLNLASPIVIDPSSGITDLFLRLHSDFSEAQTLESLTKTKQTFDSIGYEGQVHEVSRLLSVYSEYNLAPVLLDAGGAMDERGGYKPYLWNVLQELSQNPRAYIVIIQSRRIPFELLESKKLPFLETRIRPLDLDSSKLLVDRMCTRVGINARKEEIEEVAAYIDGYPPAARWAVGLCKRYGIRTFLADKSILVDLKARAFAPLLDRILINELSSQTLKILSGQTSLPVDGLALIMGVSLEELAGTLRQLIDLNFVEAVDDSVAISYPLREAVQRKFGHLFASDYARIVNALGSKYWTAGDVPADIDIVKATVHAYARAGSQIPAMFKGLTLASTLRRAAKDAYDAGGLKEWRISVQLATQALAVESDDVFTRSILFKALVRIRDYGKAAEELEVIQRTNYRGKYYLRGFLHWKKREYENAVVAFKQALASGDQGVHVYRDLADCLYRLHNTEDALIYLKTANERFRPNKYVLDLAISIAAEIRDVKTAEELLGDLRPLAAPADYAFSHAKVLVAKGSFIAAHREIERALPAGSRRREILGVKANILIELERFAEAEQFLKDLDSEEDFEQDVLNGLFCKLYIRKGDWPAAEERWFKIVEKGKGVHRALRARVLERKIHDTMVGIMEKHAAEEELSQLGEFVQQSTWTLGPIEPEEFTAATEEEEKQG